MRNERVALLSTAQSVLCIQDRNIPENIQYHFENESLHWMLDPKAALQAVFLFSKLNKMHLGYFDLVNLVVYGGKYNN